MTWRSLFLLVLLLCGPIAPWAQASEAVEVRGGEHDGFARIAVQWPAPVTFDAKRDGDTLTVHFARPFTARLGSLAGELDHYVTSAAQSANGSSIIVKLTKPFDIRTMTVDRKIAVIDLLKIKAANKQSGPPKKTAAKSNRAATPKAPAKAVARTEPPKPPPNNAAATAASATPVSLTQNMPASEASSPVAPPLPPPAAMANGSAGAPATLTPALAVQNSSVSLRFDWPEPVGAAIYRRDNAVWVAFSVETRLDLEAARAARQPLLQAIDQVRADNATVLRLVTADGINPSLRRDGNSWIIDFKQQPAAPDAPIVVNAQPDAAPPAVEMHVSQAGTPINFLDPLLGDRLVIVPLAGLGRGIDIAHDFVDFDILPSIQGVVVRPISDDLIVQGDGDMVRITRPKGLILSSIRDRVLGRAVANPHRVFDFSAWLGPPGESFIARRSELERAIITVPVAARTGPRLDLARYYFANLFGAETLAVLGQIARDDPQAATTPSMEALKGAACLLQHLEKCAAQELGQHSLDHESEIALWRASLAADEGAWPTAAADFLQSASLLSTYPKRLANHFALQAADAMLKTKRTEAAGPLLDLVLKSGPDLRDRAMALYLQGREDQQLGQSGPAIALWSKVAGMNDRKSRARARYARAMALYAAKKANRTATINVLDSLRFAWRGGRFEFRLLRQLGELKIAEGDAAGGLDALHEAAVYFPNYPEAKEVQKEAAAAFINLFVGKNADNMPAIKALALYDDFHDIEPVGAQQDAIVKNLIDRLVSVDLLDQAANLLEGQVNNRLTGQDKALGATQLALLRLMNRQPQAAIAALNIDVGTGLPPDIVRQRQELRARALLELGRASDALAMLANDNSRDAYRLRADIYWRKHDWKDAAAILSVLVGPPPAKGPLDENAARMVLNWAAALTLEGDQQGLAKLRDDFGAAMDGTSSAAAFKVLAGDDNMAAALSGNPNEIASRIAQVGALQSFMAAYKQRIAADKLSAIN